MSTIKQPETAPATEVLSGVFSVYKKLGETPLQTLNRLRIERPELKEVTLSYAGRLDPLAEGVLVVLMGAENKKRESYLCLDKSYEAEFVVGCSTDSFDMLGKVEETDSSKKVSVEDIESTLQTFIGASTLPYPSYSSKPVSGKPLFEWAREGRLSEIVIPATKGTIYSAEVMCIFEISRGDLFKIIKDRIELVTGDFRQQEILTLWETYVTSFPEHVQIARIKIDCSSGTYIRSLVHELGKKLEVPTTTWSILRTKVGDYS